MTNISAQNIGQKKSLIDSVKIDSVKVADSLKLAKTAVSLPVFSAAKDSIIEDFSGKDDKIYYYGDVTVNYGKMSITADQMIYNVNTKTVWASGMEDSTGVVMGKPHMKDEDKEYDMEEVLYNFDTKKARIKNMITKEEEGIMHGEKLKMMPDKSINISRGKYTVCHLAHPHYYLRMSAAKVVTEPSQKTVFGPAWVVVEDIPLPLILPFGFVPKTPSRSSGILFPTYGEETSRGFYLRDGGYYMVVGDYFDIALTGDIYTLGSWGTKLTSRYKSKYKYNGSLNINYSCDKTGDKGEDDYFESTNFSVKWAHSMDPKAHPGTNFSASVNFSSPSNSRYNQQDIKQAITNQTSSSISYSHKWTGMSLSVNALHSQNSRDSSYAITLPNVTFTVNRFYPFKRKVSVGKQKLYEKISLSYNTAFQNKISFKSYEFSTMDVREKLQTGITHKFAIGLPTFTLLKYFNFTPSITYGMNWYFQKQKKIYNSTTGQIETTRDDMFDDFGVTQSYSGSVSLSTRLYGMFNFGKDKKLQAIRHMITPSISLYYQPELFTPMNGKVIYNYIDNEGTGQTLEYNKWSGGLYSPPNTGRNAGLSFSFGNNIEAKVRSLQDTTGTGTKKIKILDQLSINGSYNFLADSMKMSNISISASTSIFGKLGIQGNLQLDPYAINKEGERSSQYNFQQEGWKHPFRLVNGSASMSYSLQGKGNRKGNDGADAVRGHQAPLPAGIEADPRDIYNKVYYHPITGEYIPGGWMYYMNPNVPWQLSFNYSLSYGRSYNFVNDVVQVKDSYSQTLGINGQVKMTQALSVTLNTSFDIMQQRLTNTQMTFGYDLHCFQIAVSWIPTGKWQSWSFRISAKASALADLLQFKKGSSFWDN